MSLPARHPTRRIVMTGLLAGTLGLATSTAEAADASLAYMKKAANELFNAHKQGTVSAFLPPIERYADVASIADYSLGQYAAKLPAGERDTYYKGVALFIARYFADQTRYYRIAKWEMGEPDKQSDGDILINMRVTLLTGARHNVEWRLRAKGKGFKITDVKVAGFSLIYFQRGLFVSYIRERKGDVRQLVAVLNRQPTN
jgi:ABC-type transporter MlaC component